MMTLKFTRINGVVYCIRKVGILHPRHVFVPLGVFITVVSGVLR